MNLLFFGDVVGEPGRKAIIAHLNEWKEEFEADFVVVNGENAAAGRGISQKILHQIFQAGADVVTLGDHAWDQKDTVVWINEESKVVRPINYVPSVPGRGGIVVEKAGKKLAVCVALGRTFTRPDLENPFLLVEDWHQKCLADGVICQFVEMHAEATSEKEAMGWWMDGKASVVLGTHTHVQTADDRILPKGTGYLTDVGMSGPDLSILGRDAVESVARFLDGLPRKLPIAGWPVRCCGVLIKIEESTGRCLEISRIQKVVEKIEG